MDGSEYYDLLGQAPLGEEWLKAYRENGGTGNYTATMRSLALDAEHGCRTLYRRVIIKRKEK